MKLHKKDIKAAWHTRWTKPQTAGQRNYWGKMIIHFQNHFFGGTQDYYFPQEKNMYLLLERKNGKVVQTVLAGGVELPARQGAFILSAKEILFGELNEIKESCPVSRCRRAFKFYEKKAVTETQPSTFCEL